MNMVYEEHEALQVNMRYTNQHQFQGSIAKILALLLQWRWRWWWR